MKRTYRGYQDAEGDAVVMADDKLLDLRLDVRNHSPTGFNWGYSGSGPRQLALAILCDLVGAEIAKDHGYEFCRQVISRIDHPEWTLNADFVLGWMCSQIGYDAVMRAVGWIESEGGGS